jgi:hypothetical protein
MHIGSVAKAPPYGILQLDQGLSFCRWSGALLWWVGLVSRVHTWFLVFLIFRLGVSAPGRFFYEAAAGASGSVPRRNKLPITSMSQGDPSRGMLAFFSNQARRSAGKTRIVLPPVL